MYHLTGKVCRSVMAEFIFKNMVNKNGFGDKFIIESAATSAEEIWNGVGNPIYPAAKQELKKHGIECEGKRARRVTKNDYDKFDYILCADANNIKDTIKITGPDYKNKIKLILDYSNRKGQSIADPWYTGKFADTYNDLDYGLKEFFDYIVKNNIFSS